MCTGIHFKDNSCLVAIKRTRLLRQGSVDNKKTFFPLLMCCATLFASRVITSRRPRPKSGFPSMFSILCTSVLGHLNGLYRATSSKSWSASQTKVCHDRPLRCHFRLSRPSSGDVVKPLSTYGQLQFRLVINQSSGSQQTQRKWTSASREDSTCWINRAARRSFPIRPS
ncbi:hypothetical protein DPMN_062077 [Dreissena polymorpha]|uniref:Uncharacterized protein n=1 Tax=Dreissena polymorpha TaxID=45954 RepID=A0A9D4C8K7_DREPO|nr:hypothetical protein DPMN_062077 [Dreissena polymorpha]